MPGFTPKQLLINGIPVPISMNSLEIDPGYSERKLRAASFGKSTIQYESEDLETAKSMVTFEMLNNDSGDNNDPRKLAQIWKSNGNTNTITVVPDGNGFNQYFANMSLTSKIKQKESADGTISFQFEGKIVQLT